MIQLSDPFAPRDSCWTCSITAGHFWKCVRLTLKMYLICLALFGRGCSTQITFNQSQELNL